MTPGTRRFLYRAVCIWPVGQERHAPLDKRKGYCFRRIEGDTAEACREQMRVHIQDHAGEVVVAYEVDE